MINYYIPSGDWPLREDAYETLFSMMGYTRTQVRGEATFLVLPGGVDIGVRENRDSAEREDYEAFLKTSRPIIGICRGFQLMMTECGADLIKHIPDVKTDIIHTTVDAHWTGDSSWHTTKLGLLTNSRHHQGFLDLTPEWSVLDKTQDGIIEAAVYKNMLGVQWHPEHPEMLSTPALDWFIWQVEEILKK